MSSLTHAERADRRRAIANEAKRGVPVSAIASKYGVSVSTIHGDCVEHDVHPPPMHLNVSRASKSLLIVAELLRGKSPAEIAEQFGTSRQRVHQVKNDAESAGVFEVVGGLKAKFRETRNAE